MASTLAAPFPRAAHRRALGLSGLGRLLREHPLGLVGLVVVLGMAAMALFAPLLAPYDPFATEVRSRLQPPSRISSVRRVIDPFVFIPSSVVDR